MAKSKIYRIPKRPVVSQEERLELMRINNNYKTQMRAIRRFYHEEMIKEKSTLESASSEMSQKLEAEEWERCVQLNEKWNAQVAAEREERRKKELEEMEEYALARIVAKDKELKENIEKASESIRVQKVILCLLTLTCCFFQWYILYTTKNHSNNKSACCLITQNNNCSSETRENKIKYSI